MWATNLVWLSTMYCTTCTVDVKWPWNRIRTNYLAFRGRQSVPQTIFCMLAAMGWTRLRSLLCWATICEWSFTPSPGRKHKHRFTIQCLRCRRYGNIMQMRWRDVRVYVRENEFAGGASPDGVYYVLLKSNQGSLGSTHSFPVYQTNYCQVSEPLCRTGWCFLLTKYLLLNKVGPKTKSTNIFYKPLLHIHTHHFTNVDVPPLILINLNPIISGAGSHITRPVYRCRGTSSGPMRPS